MSGVVRIQTGAKEPIEVLAVDARNEPLTGLANLQVRIRRLSDDLYFDWTDDSFKPSPAQLHAILAEIDPAKFPGEYRLDTGAHDKGFDTSAITNPIDDDTYRLTVVQLGSPLNAANFPQIGEIKVGDWVDYFDQAISDNASPAEVTQALRDFGLDHLVSVNPGVVPPAAGTYIRQVLDKLDAISAAQAAVYWVQQSWSFNPAGPTLVGQIWVESQNLVVAAPTSATVTWYDEDGAVLFSLSGLGPDAQGVFKAIKDSPNLLSNRSYYSIATVAIPGYGNVAGAKGSFTIG